MNKELNKSIQNFIAELFNFFFPKFCSSCKAKLSPHQDIICESCINKIKRASPELIKYEFERKFKNENLIQEFYPLYIFEKDKEFQYILHQLKYNGKFYIGTFLGKTVAKELGDHLNNLSIDIVIPVPLHNLKIAERGYNQSDFIAKGLCKVLRLKYGAKILKRRKFTQSQTTMSLPERKENIKDAFKLNKKKVILNKNILLIDDVITTGATVSECAKVLINNGAAKVYAASAGITDI